MTIKGLIIIGALLGGLAALPRNAKVGCTSLLAIPLAMIAYAHLEISDPKRIPDALDALLYLFYPLWPTLGAILGFTLGRGLRQLFV